jgi:hypothetical protein
MLRGAKVVTRTKLGSVWTDVATILIGDPCRFVKNPDESPEITYDELMAILRPPMTDAESAEYAELEAKLSVEPSAKKALGLLRKMNELLKNSRSRDISNYEARQIPPHKGLAVNVGCDGYYPVYLVRNAKGEPVRIEILLGGRGEP